MPKRCKTFYRDSRRIRVILRGGPNLLLLRPLRALEEQRRCSVQDGRPGLARYPCGSQRTLTRLESEKSKGILYAMPSCAAVSEMKMDSWMNHVLL